MLDDLTNEEMLRLATAWCGGDARSLLLSTPELAPLTPHLEVAREALAALESERADARVDGLSRMAAGVARRRDLLGRGLHDLLGGLALLAGNGPGADALLHVRTRLMPDGPGGERTYREQADLTARVCRELEADRELRALMEATTGNGRSLSAYVAEWIKKGRALGELELQRGALGAAAFALGSQRSVEARRRWLRAVRALLACAEVAGLGPEAEDLLLGGLREAVARAERRGPPSVPPSSRGLEVVSEAAE